MSVLLTLSSKDKPLTFYGNPFRRPVLGNSLFRTLLNTRIGTKTNLKIESFGSCTQLSFQYNQSAKLAHHCTCFFNTCVQFVVLSTITRECNSKIIKLLCLLRSYFIVSKEHWIECLDIHLILVLAVLILFPVSKHASENRSSAYWRSFLFKFNNARSSANSRRRTLHSPNVTPLLKELSLSILSMYIMNRIGERTQPCCSPTLKLKGFVFMPSTKTQASHCLHNDLIAANS